MNKDLYHKIFSVLADGNRLAILKLLKEKGMAVSSIYKNIGAEQSLISHHLKILKNFGFVDSRIEGKKRIYSANREFIVPLLSLLDKYSKTSKILPHDIERWLNMHPVESIEHETAIVTEKIYLLNRSVNTIHRKASRKRLAEIVEFFNNDMESHFRSEEKTLFPVMLKKDRSVSDLVKTLQTEHEVLRGRFSELEDIAGNLNRDGKRKKELMKLTKEITDILKIHVMKEDNILLPQAKLVLNKKELAGMQARA